MGWLIGSGVSCVLLLPEHSTKGEKVRAWAAMQAIKNLCREVGITRNDTEIPLHKLDHHIRADLDSTSERVLAVLRPLRLVLTNLPPDYSHSVDAKVAPLPACSPHCP